MKIDNLLLLPFDLYTRNKIISLIIKEIKHNLNLTGLKILDVGGRSGKLKDFLDPTDELWILDIRGSESKEENYLVGDIKNNNFKNGEFHVVISADVYEHIPSEDRIAVLSEMMRVSSHYVVLVAPFNSPEVVNAEILANELFRKITGEEHIWLKEHIINKLPFESDLENYLKEKGLKFTKVGSNNIETWLLMQSFTFFANVHARNIPEEKVNNICLYYNSFYRELGDAVEPTYRKIYLISKIGALPNFEMSAAIINHEKLENLNNLILTAIIDSFMEQNNIIVEKESLIMQVYNTRGWQLLEMYRNSKLIKGVKFLRREGFKKTLKKIREKGYLGGVNLYEVWIVKNEPSSEELNRIKECGLILRYRPKISIITPVYNTDEKWLRLAIESVVNQVYNNWELCIADGGSTKPYIKAVIEEYKRSDSRIKAKYLSENKGIAGNSSEALSLATGEFIGFLDHDDELSPNALYEVVKLLNENQAIDFIYSDEDKISTKGERFDPHFKPEWSPDTFRSYNYICHLSVIRKRLIDEVEGFREGYEGSQDYDLFLRVVERTQRIAHIPKVIYHWRSHELSASADTVAKPYAYESAKKALNEHLERMNLSGAACDGPILGSYRIKYLVKDHPMISIIIPTKDNVDMLKKCVSSILERSSYNNYKIFVVDNQSTEKETFHYYKKLEDNPKVKILNHNQPFNFSSINNYAVTQINSEYMIFLNNDTEVITPDWIETMLEFAQRSDVGAVGCLLLYPDDTIQHAGVIVGLGGVAGHSHKHFSRNTLGYLVRAKIAQNLSAITGACLMIKKEIFKEVNGFDEDYSHAFNDVDLCLKIRENDYLIVYTPYAQLYHHESLSRGHEDTLEKQLRFGKEIEIFKQRWGHVLEKGDPYYNPNLTLDKEDFSIKI